MRKWLEKKWVQAVLVLLVLLIWGYNMYSIADITTGEEKEREVDMTSDLNTDALSTPEINEYIYEADFKDPFQPKLNREPSAQQPEEKKEPKQKQKKRRPKLNLTGIVEAVALIQNQDSELFFVTTGDMVEGARIQRVTEDSVVLVFEADEFTLKVNNY